MGGSRSTPRPALGASATDEGSGLAVGGAASGASSGARDPARGAASSVRPSRISAGGGSCGTRSPGAANADPASKSSSGSKHQRISRAAARPITVRNMARLRSAAKPDQRPMQNGATRGQLGLHRWSTSETHSDRNHRKPSRKPKTKSAAEQCLRKRHTRGERRQAEYPQRIVKTRLIGAAALQSLDEAEQ